jgi:hypothetical protein
MAEHAPTPWTYRDVSGAGLEIRAPVFLAKGIELPIGMPDEPIKVFEFTAPQNVQIAAERWVQFEPTGWSEMQEANAAFIVKAVNNHEEALEIIEALLGLELGSGERAMAFLDRVGNSLDPTPALLEKSNG